MIYFYYCESYSQTVLDPVDRNVRKKLSEYSSRENLKGINSVAAYTGGIYVLNLMNPHHKVILQEQRISVPNNEELQVYFVREIINMSQNFNWLQNYVEIRDGKWLEYNPLSNDEVARFLASVNNLSISAENKQSPPEQLLSWHHQYELKVDYDIYEGEDWVKFAMSNDGLEGMKDDEAKLFRLTLVDLLRPSGKGDASFETIKSENNYEVKVITKNDVSIFYSIILFENINKPIYLLLNGANVKTQEEYYKQIKEKLERTEYYYDSIESVQRIALRAYPQWALKEADLWKAIQKNSETGNLSLLPEQTVFLKEFTFPKYINGQAGSGKSTMLYYLFANVYYYKCFDEIKGDVIFLTENEDLLKHTKKSIVELLQCNPEFELSLEDIANVDKHFVSFKDFLLRQIPSDNTEFSPEKYLGFSNFKVLYESSTIPKHIKHRYSAELVWFAMSTYIYGYDLDYQITSTNYEVRMPSEGKQLLSIQDLQGIEKDVLPFYRKLLEDQGFWDKTKIIRYIKKNITNEKLYDVIFCDEAQDFSRVELRYILNLSTYLQYDLSNTTQVPIVFAGDALQTVNPTGFRAAEVKDMLYKELKEIAGFDLDTNKIEYAPTFNYRSSQPIVNVANAIQYWRKKHFQSDIKKPQIAKRPEFTKDSHLNVFLDYDVVESNKNGILDKLKYKIFIIPVNSDDRDEYIANSSILKRFPDINVKTAVEAKGIDYDQVVLYGFGEYAKELNHQEEYELRFFYNKLYVAVTRAQHELIILDNAASEEYFWKPLIDFYAGSNWSTESEVKSEEIRDTIVFGANQISNVMQSTPAMAIENAVKDKNQGIFDKNPFLLRVAANQFLRLGNKAEYYICLALMYKLQAKWEEAAKCYLRKEVGLEGFISAADTYWQGKMLSEFVGLSADPNSETQKIRLIIANLILFETLQSNDLNYLHEKRNELRIVLKNTHWREEIIRALLSYLEKTVDNEPIKILIDIFEEICTASDRDVWCKIGNKNFAIQRYEYAITAFEKCGEEGVFYVRSKIEVSLRKEDIPELIFWKGRLMKELEDFYAKKNIRKEIIELYSTHKETLLRQEPLFFALLYVYEALLIETKDEAEIIEIGRFAERLASSTNNIKVLIDFYKDLLQGPDLSSNNFQYVLSRWAQKLFQLSKDVSLINEIYKHIAFINKVRFHVFTSSELNDLPSIPTKAQKDLPNHIQTITIKNFRGFDEVRIENMSLLNLVVGDNNIGKTSFLEALLFIDDKRELLRRLAFAYIERRNIYPDRSINSEEARYVYNLDEKFLLDYKNYNNESWIEFIIEQNRESWEFRLKLSKSSTTPVNIDSLEFTDIDYRSLTDIAVSDSIKTPFIPYGKGFGIDLAKAYLDEIGTKPRLEQEFLNNMKLFIPTVNRIIVDTANGSIELLDSDYPENYRPLHQYGEGANKLFRILVSLALHKGKRVLIDEIDAGIHYSRFKFFWKIVLEIAKKDQTQVIATTHNDECIRYFNEVVAELGQAFQMDSRVIQLKQVAGNIKIRSYPFESFNSAIEGNLEIRGEGVHE